MKKIIKWGAIIFSVSGALFIAVSLFIHSKRKACLEGEGPSAIEACSFLISAHTAGYTADYLARRAFLSGKEGRSDAVISDLSDLIAMKITAQVQPGQILSAYETLVKIYSEKGDAGALRKYLELAAQNGSKDPGVYILLAEVYNEEKKFQAALNLLETAGGLENARKHPYYNAQASAYEGLNDFEKAYEALKEGLKVPAVRPVLAGTSKHLGLVCYELKRYGEAETYLAYALKAGADCSECGLLLTTIRESLAPTVRPSRKPRK